MSALDYGSDVAAERARGSADGTSVSAAAARLRHGDLVDYWGRDWSSHIVELDGTPYVAKHSSPLGARLDLLGFCLARDRFNVPEVRLADDQLRSTIGRPECSHIVRLCQSYRRTELAVTDLSVAIAGELVFSTWINRRDAHNHNRVFVRRVPMFYDFGAAFEEMPGEERGGFFREGRDPGWVPNWRLAKVPPWRRLDSREIRRRERQGGGHAAMHPIGSWRGFWRAFDDYGKEISSLSDDEVGRRVASCEFSDEVAVRILAALVRDRDDLRPVLERVRTILTVGAGQ